MISLASLAFFELRPSSWGFVLAGNAGWQTRQRLQEGLYLEGYRFNPETKTTTVPIHKLQEYVLWNHKVKNLLIPEFWADTQWGVKQVTTFLQKAKFLPKSIHFENWSGPPCEVEGYHLCAFYPDKVRQCDATKWLVLRRTDYESSSGSGSSQ